MKNAVFDPNVEEEEENQSGRIGCNTWGTMLASTLQPSTSTSHRGILSVLGEMDEELHSPHCSLWLHLAVRTRSRIGLWLAQSQN